MIRRYGTLKIEGTRSVSPEYEILNSGATKTILLIGHADIDDPADYFKPFFVNDIKKALRFIKADDRLSSPLSRGLMEVFAAGALDVVLYPVAPMSEYIDSSIYRLLPNADWGGLTFYEQYHQRLEQAYEYLRQDDRYDIIVPLEAPYAFSGSVDFCTQLADLCADCFNENGNVVLGVMGTNSHNPNDSSDKTPYYTNDTVRHLSLDNRVALLHDKGKFLCVVVGQGLFRHAQSSLAYTRPFDATVAGMLANTPVDRGIAGSLFPVRMINLAHREFTSNEIDMLSLAKLNTVGKTSYSRRSRGNSQMRMLNDLTLGQDGSDYWSIAQMNLVSSMINTIRKYGLQCIGRTNGYESFQRMVASYIDILESTNHVKAISYTIERAENDPYAAVVNLSINPIFGIKTINFTIVTTPGV